MAETKTKKPAKTPFGEKIAKFFREYRSEIKKISWAKPSQTFNNTWAVVVASVAISVVIGLVDLGVSQGLLLLGRLI